MVACVARRRVSDSGDDDWCRKGCVVITDDDNDDDDDDDDDEQCPCDASWDRFGGCMPLLLLLLPL